MDAFSYLSVLLSIIIGLAITQVLQGYRALLLARRSVKLYWVPLLWSATILLIAVQMWWSSFGLRTHTDWTFVGFFAVLMQTVLLYMMAAVVLPDFPSDAAVDLREHFFRERLSFSLLLLAILVASLAKTWALDQTLGDPVNLAFHGVFASAALLAAVVKRPIVHEVLAPVTTLAMMTYIGLLFARL